MRQIDIIPLTKIPLPCPQILTYFSAEDMPAGALAEIPLGRRQTIGLVLQSRKIDKMQIKKADFGLKKISRVIAAEPVLTNEQIKLALFLGRYYFASPCLFIKMMLSPAQRLVKRKIDTVKKLPREKKISSGAGQQTAQTLILSPTVAAAEKIGADRQDAVLWHNGLTVKQKNEIREKTKNGEISVVVGTRSAAFLPFVRLKKIIIKDAQNPNHKSWDMRPRFSALTAARKLAEIFNATMEEQNDTNSDENEQPTAVNAPLKIVDMREEFKEKNFSVFSHVLENAVQRALAKKEQIIFFINRRGAANFIFCRDCGRAIHCPSCETPLTLHFINGEPKLFCHRCGHKNNPPSRCPECHSLHLKTAGAGAQKIESEADKFFPGAKIARLDGDSAPRSIQQQKIIAQFLKKEIDILIATQIVFSWKEEIKKSSPQVAALLSADSLLNLPDYRSGERAWRTIFALRNFLNRRDGELFIQTCNPANQVLKYAAQNNWRDFWQEEIETRQILNYPPYSQIVKLTFRHRDGKKAGQEAQIMAAKLRHIAKNEKIEISPALPALIPKEKGKFVWNIILKFPTAAIDDNFLRQRNFLLRYAPSSWTIDVEPESIV